ncbi:TRAFAC clade GTPase domain-containing protein [Vibrio parahaemolyticus]|uniref:TRAFAC clade GTPase domain-containing protein n=1 Tax=Vibrio parahaemolyticus TaxID=670 RepID=UPI001E304470|nr:hypothetical protein [Vibrio parahaemolyticus]
MDHTKCHEWTGQEGEAASQEEGSPHELVLPWSGGALGLIDLGFVAGRAKPLVVGIIGHQNAGKTTLLAAWYLLLGRGLICGDYQFAGSYSLAGWEAVASSLRWAPGHSPSFPPHTTSRGGRTPGLLHLDFRHSKGESRGYMFADAPGEWFQKWAANRDSADGAGARWVAEHADLFLLVADCEALAGPSKGAARGAFLRLVERLASEKGRRPVALVWTKSDVKVAPEMEEVVRQTVFSTISDVVEFAVSTVVDDGDTLGKGKGFLELLDWTLQVRRGRVVLPSVDTTSVDPLFMFGKR